MIKTRKDLCDYLKADRKANLGYTKSINPFKYLVYLLYKQENFLAYRYLKILRNREYHVNNKGTYHKLMSLYYRVRQNRLSIKYGVQIHHNMVDKGLTIMHLGGVIINCKSMGTGCTVSCGVIVGNKDSQANRATIGNNVNLSIGCKVIGKVTLGDNVIVAPNSVVVKDVPANGIVSGIPAQLLKIRE